jgi:hypothetical protein
VYEGDVLLGIGCAVGQVDEGRRCGHAEHSVVKSGSHCVCGSIVCEQR